MAKTVKRAFGDWGEAQAVQFLKTKKYEIIELNYQAKHCEIDIIAWHKKTHPGRTLCFVEVKTRRQNDGSAERATNYGKLKHILHAARTYCLAHHIAIDTTPIQFEQVSVYLDDLSSGALCKHDVIPVN